jgi:hypothetical protein
LRRNLNCSLNCGEPRHRRRCMSQGLHRRQPASLRLHRRGWPRRRLRGWLRRRLHQGWPLHPHVWRRRPHAWPLRRRRRVWRPRRRPGWLHHRRVRRPRRQGRARRVLDADCQRARSEGIWPVKALNRGAEGPKIRPYFLASGWNPAIHRAISHGNMAQKAVRWQPGHKARLLTRFRRNQPENYHYGATRFFYASAA